MEDAVRLHFAATTKERLKMKTISSGTVFVLIGMNTVPFLLNEVGSGEGRWLILAKTTEKLGWFFLKPIEAANVTVFSAFVEREFRIVWCYR